MSDGISYVKSNPYGQKSIEITNAAYSRLVKPTFPYLEKPASYAKPYVAKADEVGENILNKIDEKFPVLKSETEEIKSTVVDYIHWPAKVAGEQRDYILKTYNDEYKRCGGDGVVAGGKALVSGSMVITSEWLSFFASLLQQKKEEAAGKVKEATEAVKEKADN